MSVDLQKVIMLAGMLAHYLLITADAIFPLASL